MKNHLILFFHFAGGNRYSLKAFETLVDADCFFVELPGRGKRMTEDLLTDIDTAVPDIIKQIEPLIAVYPSFSLFGHSMGALLNYLVIHHLVAANKKLPTHLFVSGKGAPSVKRNNILRYNLPSTAFWQEISKYNGTSKEVLKNEELVALFEPILRADFQIIEEYTHTPKPKLPFPIVGFFGTDDDITNQEADAWQEETTVNFERHWFPGGHFFILEYFREIGDVMNRLITERGG